MSQVESEDAQRTDREPLTLAARAIGFDLYVNQAGALQLWQNGAYVRFWNPLHDDGDAFRLAVVLGLDINVYPASNETSACKFKRGIMHRCIERTQSDAFAATRRAIVRAAAEIGRAMP